MTMGILFEAVAATFALLLAAFVSYRRFGAAQVRRSLVACLFLFGLECALSIGNSLDLEPARGLLLERLRFLLIALLPGCLTVFSLTYARGNDGSLGRYWKVGIPGYTAAALGFVGLTWTSLLHDGECSAELVALGWSGVALHLFLVLGCVLCLMNLERTLRTATGTMRWRIKYMIVGLGMVLAVRCYSSSQSILYSALTPNLSVMNAAALILGSGLMFLSVKRDSLKAVALYPSHGVLHGSVTLLLAGAYLLLIGLSAELAVFLGVARWLPVQAFVVLMCLFGVAVILLSDRLRQKTRLFVSRHFRRGHYDYRRIWSLFSERAVSLGDPPAFCREVTAVIADTLETLSVTLWLLDPDGRRLSFGGSTALTEMETAVLTGRGRLSEEEIRLLRNLNEPVDVRAVPHPLGALLHRIGRKEFPNSGTSYCMALTARNTVLGLLVLGDRVNGLPFTLEELDLLKTIGNHLAASLLNIRLSHHLADAKKLEAFQAMSTFFVHDLKNTAYALSLMLKNLEKHFDDPAFKQDAQKAVSRTVDRLNGLIERLAFLRRNLDVHLLEGDLNEVVRKAIADLGGPSDLLTGELAPVDRVQLDAEQMYKVVTNLLLNARDAAGPQGHIQVRTGQRDGWVFLSVSDDGCGMSEAFIEGSLFKPFQTTKKQGLGIGLFHSKMIVEAHQGRVEVESRQGEGSTFRVCLPIREGQV